MTRVTQRDIQLVRDLALSRVLSRDQAIELGYFNSLTRANARLLGLIRHGLARRVGTPFHAQGIYAVGRNAPGILDGQVSRVAESRLGDVRFLRHSLAVTDE